MFTGMVEGEEMTMTSASKSEKSFVVMSELANERTGLDYFVEAKQAVSINKVQGRSKGPLRSLVR